MRSSSATGAGVRSPSVSTASRWIVSSLCSQTIRTRAASGKTSSLRRAAVEAIGDAAADTSDVETLDKAQRAIENAIFNDRDRDVQMEAIDALDELPRDRAVRVLRSVIDRHPDADVREEARDQLQDREASK